MAPLDSNARYARGSDPDRNLRAPAAMTTASVAGHTAANFSEFWAAAAHVQAHSRFEGGRAATRWLLASDSVALKRDALAHYRLATPPLYTTSISPSHAAYEHMAEGAEERLIETVAEMLLLSRSNALVYANSRYALGALLFCRCCTVAWRIRINTSCPYHSPPAQSHASQRGLRDGMAVVVPASTSQHVDLAEMHCFGTHGIYSASAVDINTVGI